MSEYPRTSRNAALLFFLLHPGMSGQGIHREWTEHPVLKDYKQPDRQTLVSWVEEFVACCNGLGSYEP